MRVFGAGCGSGGGGGVKENVEVSIFQRIDRWKTYIQKDEGDCMGSKQGKREREREMGEREC